MISRLPVKRLCDHAYLPTRSKLGDAGLDLYSPVTFQLTPGTHAILGTGIAVGIPHGYVGLIWPRSGLSAKQGVDVLAGVIDHQYRSEVKVALDLNLHDTRPYQVEAGDRIAQLLVQPVELPEVEEVSDLGDESRGGFGSTGR